VIGLTCRSSDACTGRPGSRSRRYANSIITRVGSLNADRRKCGTPRLASGRRIGDDAAVDDVVVGVARRTLVDQVRVLRRGRFAVQVHIPGEGVGQRQEVERPDGVVGDAIVEEADVLAPSGRVSGALSISAPPAIRYLIVPAFLVAWSRNFGAAHRTQQRR
jgi:hypothetical protein